MPVDFLTADQEQQYGRYLGEPSPAQLARYFHLDDGDRALVLERRDEHVRLGLAVQLGTVRFLGTFLPDPTTVPAVVASFLATQLSIEDPSCLARYAGRPATQSAHVQLIRERYGYRDFAEQPEHFRLVRWLYGRAWLSAERPSVLFDLTTARLVERKVLLPGVTVLARLVASVRDRAATRLWRMLASLPSPEQRRYLEALLVIPAQARQTLLDRLRRAPTRVSAAALVQALTRVQEVRALGVGSLDLTRLPRGRVIALARYASAARAQTIARMPEARRVATFSCSPTCSRVWSGPMNAGACARYAISIPPPCGCARRAPCCLMRPGLRQRYARRSFSAWPRRISSRRWPWSRPSRAHRLRARSTRT